jgi:hypothetical protein
VQSGDGLRLLAVSPGVVPTVVEEHGDDVHAPAFGHGQEGEDVLDELVLVPHVGRDVQEHTHLAEAQLCRPTQLAVHRLQVQLFPHLDLVVGIGRDVVGSRAPQVAAIPLEGLLLGPPALSSGKQDQKHCYQQ